MDMKFINKNGTELEFKEGFNVVESSLSPFKEIVKKQESTGFAVKFEENEVKFDDIFTLQFNVKKVGSVSCLFKKDDLNKEEIINEITNLKEIKVKDIDTAKSKIKSLLEIIKKYNSLFVVYKPNGDFLLNEDQFKEATDLVTFYMEQVNEDAEIDDSKKVKLENPIKVIKKDKYHFLFAIIASFLIGFTISIAIFDIYLGKLIYIFFFICSIAGMTLNGFIYNDSMKKNKFLSTHFIITSCSTLLGLALSVGGYLIFKNVSKDKPAQNPSIFLMIIIAILLILLSAGIAFVIRKLKQKKRAK